MDNQAEINPGISRRTLIKRGAIVGGTVLWAAPVIDSFMSPAFAAGTPSPELCCRFTGGGNSSSPDAELVTAPIEGTPVQFGFELHCGPTPAEPNRLNITFYRGQDLVTFHLFGADRGGVYEATCYAPATGTPDAPCSRIEGSGTGWTTGPGTDDLNPADVTFDIVDLGPEAGDQDNISFTIHYVDENGVAQTFTVSGHPGGNNQAHRVTGSKADCG